MLRTVRSIVFYVVSCLLLPPGILAQTDIPVSQIGPYITIGRGLAWGVGGVGGINNGFVFTPPSADTGICVGVYNNNPSNAHTFVMTAYVTPDPAAVGAVIAPSHWQLTSGALSTSTPAASMTTYFVKTPGAAKIEIVFSDSAALAGTPDTADVIVAHSQTGCGSLTGNASLQTAGLASGSMATSPLNGRSGIWCGQNQTIKIATAATGTINGGVGLAIHVCSYSVTGPVTGASSDIVFASGTVGTCAAPGGILWELTTDINVPNYALSDAQGEIFETALGQPLCITNVALGSTVTVSLSFTVF